VTNQEYSWLENSQLVLQTLRRLDKDIKEQDARRERYHDDMRAEISALRSEVAALKQQSRSQAGVIAFLVALGTSVTAAIISGLIGRH
jgi:hypothetical protein